MIVRLLRKALETRVSPVPQAVFRIGIALTALGEVRQLQHYRHLLFDTVPHLVAPRLDPGLLLALWSGALLSVLVGWQVRKAALVSWVLAAGMFGLLPSRGLDYHNDGVLIFCLLVLTFAPGDGALAIDAMRWRARRAAGGTAPQRQGSALPVVFLVLGIGLIYADSIVHKLRSTMWMSGLGFWAPAQHPQITWIDVSPLMGPGWLMVIVGYIVFAYEAAFLPLFGWRRARLPLLILGLILHAGIAIAYPLPLFGLSMCAMLAGCVPGEYYARLGTALRRRRRTMHGDNAAAGTVPAGPVVADPAEAGPKDDAAFADRDRDLRARLAAAAIATAALVQLLLMAGLGMRLGTVTPLAVSVRELSYPLTGLRDHPVFIDAHFRDYLVQSRLEHRPVAGPPRSLPVTTRVGTTGWRWTGRMWVWWNWRTVHPRLERAGLERIVRDWAWRYGTDLVTGGTVVLQQRPVQVTLDRWQPDRLRRNRAVPWQDVLVISGDVTSTRPLTFSAATDSAKP